MQDPQQNTKNNPSKPQLKNSRLEELHDSMILYSSVKNKTKTSQTKSELPTISNNSNTDNKVKLTRQFGPLKDNRHLRYLFHQFCKQSYVGGINATFDQISQSADKMTLNKWMVFCKEFDLTKKLSSREMRLIFRKATKQGSEMDILSFCQALQRVQIKANIDQRELVKNVLHADCHDSARNRICSMKIHFAGPKTNFFMEGTLPQKVREEQKKAQKKFKEKKQKEYILIQGKFRQHIQREVKEMKMIREMRNRNLRNHSAAPTNNTNIKPQITLDRYKNQSLMKSPLSTRSKVTNNSFGSYSKIYHTHKVSMTSENNSFLGRGRKTEEIQSKSRLLYEKQRQQQNEEVRIRDFNIDEKLEDEVQSHEEQKSLIQQRLEELTQQPEWLVESDVESDDILKSHFQNQKKIKENLQKRKQLQKSKISEKPQQLNQEEEDTDFMITRYT